MRSFFLGFYFFGIATRNNPELGDGTTTKAIDAAKAEGQIAEGQIFKDLGRDLGPFAEGQVITGGGFNNTGVKTVTSPSLNDPLPPGSLDSTEDLVAKIQAERDLSQKIRLINTLSLREGISRVRWLLDVVGDDKYARLAVPQSFLGFDYNREQAESILAQAKSPSERNRWAKSLAFNFPESDYETALAFAEANLIGNNLSRSVADIYGRVIDKDLDTGIDLVMRMPKGNLRESLIVAISFKKAREDLSHAAEWIDQLNDPKERVAAFKQLCYIWVEKDSKSAIEFGKKISSQLERAAFYQVVVGNLAQENPQRSIQLIEGFEVSLDQKGNMLHSAFTLWAQQDPQAAAEGIEVGSYNESTKARLRNRVFGLWADVDPKKTLAWVEKMPESRERTLSISRVAKAWIAKNPQEATEWVRGLEKGKIRDSAIEGLIRTRVSDSQAEALKLALEISDGRKRLRQAAIILKKAKTPESKDEILQLIEEADLPEEEEGELLRVLFEEAK